MVVNCFHTIACHVFIKYSCIKGQHPVVYISRDQYIHVFTHKDFHLYAFLFDSCVF